jgi:hypothetical protein
MISLGFAPRLRSLFGQQQLLPFALSCLVSFSGAIHSGVAFVVRRRSGRGPEGVVRKTTNADQLVTVVTLDAAAAHLFEVLKS